MRPAKAAAEAAAVLKKVSQWEVGIESEYE
jgi:hypothetical protein